MNRILAATLLYLTFASSCIIGQEAADIDTSRTTAYGPNEARGTIEQVKRHVPFHQHVWKAVEYPSQAAVRIVSLPLKGAGYLLERDSDVGDFTELFYFDGGHGYIFPSIFAESDRGVSGALTFSHNSLLPSEMGLSVRLCYGGRVEHEYRVRVDKTGFFHEAAGFSLSAHDIRHSDRYFYGVGMQSQPADRVSYTQRDRLAIATWNVAVFRDVTAVIAAAYRHAELLHYDRLGIGDRNSEERWETEIRMIYDDRAYGDLSPYGWRIAGSVARALAARSSDSDYWSYAASVQRHFNIYRNTRVLHLSVKTEGIERIANEAVPFWDLPILDGSNGLRGFSPDRFRDDVTLAFSAHYLYPVYQRLYGSLFVDFASAAPGWDAYELKRFEVGYGWGLESYLDDDLRFRFEISHSREGLQAYLGVLTEFGLIEGEATR